MDEMGKRLAAVRKALKISQELLGTKIKRSKNTVSRYERGIEIIPPFVIDILCNELGANRDFLLEGVGTPLVYDDRCKKLIGEFMKLDETIQDMLIEHVTLTAKQFKQVEVAKKQN